MTKIFFFCSDIIITGQMFGIYAAEYISETFFSSSAIFKAAVFLTRI